MKKDRRQEKMRAFGRLLDIMDDLREKCPWDRKQTLQSLSTLTIEETYELVDEIEKNDMEGVKEELGDIMLHLVFYAKIADERGAFDVADAIHDVCDKLVRRHPHVYANTQVQGDAEVKKNWEKIKMSEKGKKSIFQGVPNALPAVIKAQRMQEKAAQVGFEWNKREEVWAKVSEEIAELEVAVSKGELENMTEEFGDVLFSLINYSRFIKVDANRALDLTNRKFKKRIEYIEKYATKPLSDMTLSEMDALWEKAKHSGL